MLANTAQTQAKGALHVFHQRSNFRTSRGGARAVEPAQRVAGLQHRGLDSESLYRVPHQPSLDGNTVEADVEQSEFSENALRYQASLRFINGRVSTLRAAITGTYS